MIVATLLIAIGWIVVLLNSERYQQTGPVQSLPSFPRTVPAHSDADDARLSSARTSSAIQVALRGYIRGDLKPKTYNVITVRILMAVILAWALEALMGDNTVVLALSFLAGLVPNTIVLRIREAGLRSRAAADELKVKSPLSGLDDIDVYELTRLEEEGITSIQALARHDLVDLTLSSRIPVPRLIDWVDQAILHQHLPDVRGEAGKVGIRTATDYLRVCSDESSREQLVEVMQCIEAMDKVPVPAALLRDSARTRTSGCPTCATGVTTTAPSPRTSMCTTTTGPGGSASCPVVRRRTLALSAPVGGLSQNGSMGTGAPSRAWIRPRALWPVLVLRRSGRPESGAGSSPS